MKERCIIRCIDWRFYVWFAWFVYNIVYLILRFFIRNWFYWGIDFIKVIIII